MTVEQAKASIRAAAWALVALVGYESAKQFLNDVRSELDNKQWSDR